MKVFRHPKYYEELRKIRKKFLREQADKRASEQADKQGSEQASEELKSLQAYVKKTKKPI